MTKEYREEVHGCFDCPNFRKLEDRDTSIDWCRMARKPLNSLNFPDWCPLPDKVVEKKVELES